MAEIHVIVGQKIKCRRCGYEWAPRRDCRKGVPSMPRAKWDIELTEKERARREAAGRPVPAK